MKGIIVEIDKKDAVVLANDGRFIKVRNENYEIGQKINIKQNSRNTTVRRWVTGAASIAAAMAFCTIGAYAYFTPTDYVSLDVNPSVEYSVNMFDRILDVKAVNDDGAEILSSLDLDNMTIEDAVKDTLDQLIADGYLTDDPDGGVVITTSNDELEEAEQLAAELEQEIQNFLDSREGVAADVEAEAVSPERVQEARELGVTPGKLNLVEKLQASTSGAINTEEWLTMPVKEINKAIKENRKQEKEKTKNKDTFQEDRPVQSDAVSKGGVNLKNDKSEKTDKERNESQNNKVKDQKLDDDEENLADNEEKSDDQLPAEEQPDNGDQKDKTKDKTKDSSQKQSGGNKPPKS